MVAKNEAGDPLWRCSGTLISPTVFVTAGHCTESPAVAATIWFDEEVTRAEDPANPTQDEYPNGGPGTYDGTTHVHPDYNPNGFFLYDLGVVQLDEPVPTTVTSGYGKLPTAGVVDELANGRKKAVVRAVGYGLQKVNPVMIEDDLVRRKADLFVVDTTGVAGIGNLNTGPGLPPTNSMMLSGDAKHGGTCSGDSGGPIFIGNSNVIAGVTSFGLNANCAGIGGAFRIDRDVELDWIDTFTAPPPTP